ncbi:MAG: GntR family transcriptional regulator [Candidatus Ornithospirochaeta sp.]
MTIFISQSSSTPIYAQIEFQIKDQILSGALLPGTALPSMRTLAKDLRVSVITVQKAYENLTREGFITTGVGRGTAVSPLHSSFLRDENLKRVEEGVKKVVEDAKSGNIGKEEVLDMVEKYFSKGDDHDNS